MVDNQKYVRNVRNMNEFKQIGDEEMLTWEIVIFHSHRWYAMQRYVDKVCEIANKLQICKRSRTTRYFPLSFSVIVTRLIIIYYTKLCSMLKSMNMIFF